ncbi:hypothetical protein PFISCL1PPCAC_17294, partial [Pristionchus fissidentatus]
IADIFHLSYGESELCLAGEDDGTELKACSDAIKFDVFNKSVCQSNALIKKECDENHKICEPAAEADNVFSCPDSEKNAL